MRTHIRASGAALALLVLGCLETPDQEPPPARRTVQLSMPSAGATSQVVSFCRSLDAGWLSELFAVDAEQIRRRSSFPVRGADRVHCTAEWDVHNRQELEQSYREARDRWSRDGSPPAARPSVPRFVHRVSVTLLGTEVSPNAAVDALEKQVETLTTGIAVEADGQEVFAQVSFGPWAEVGDRAVFRGDGSLQVAAAGDLMIFGVLVSQTATERREETLEVARRFLADRAPRGP